MSEVSLHVDQTQLLDSHFSVHVVQLVELANFEEQDQIVVLALEKEKILSLVLLAFLKVKTSSGITVNTNFIVSISLKTCKAQISPDEKVHLYFCVFTT